MRHHWRELEAACSEAYQAMERIQEAVNSSKLDLGYELLEELTVKDVMMHLVVTKSAVEQLMLTAEERQQ